MDAVRLGGDHRGRTSVRDFPIEKLGTKISGFLYVLAANFEVDDWTAHAASCETGMPARPFRFLARCVLFLVLRLVLARS